MEETPKGVRSGRLRGEFEKNKGIHVQRGKVELCLFCLCPQSVGPDINNLFGGDAKAWHSTQDVVQ